jgi:hypothetical protein
LGSTPAELWGVVAGGGILFLWAGSALRALGGVKGDSQYGERRSLCQELIHRTHGHSPGTLLVIFPAYWAPPGPQVPFFNLSQDKVPHVERHDRL